MHIVQWLYEYIYDAMGLNAKHTAAPDIREEDIIVFMDAYDVLLFPSVRNIARHFHLSPTPIVFCTEHGLYPEFASNGRYTREGFYQRDYYQGSGSGMGGGRNISGSSGSVYAREELVEEYVREHYLHDLLDAKQLNSGCYLGRAKQVYTLYTCE